MTHTTLTLAAIFAIALLLREAWERGRRSGLAERLDVAALAKAAQDHETSGIHGPLHCSLACGATLADVYLDVRYPVVPVEDEYSVTGIGS